MITTSQKQKGFAHAVLIIGLIIALIGTLGFIFWQNFIHEDPVVTKTETVKVDEVAADEEQNKIPDGWTEYKNAKTGVSFLHPLTWSVEDNSTEDFGLSLSVKSDDFVETPNSAYGGTDMGVSVRIGFQDKDGDEEIDGILNGSDVLSENISEVSEELDINGDRGVSYGIGYEGPPSFITLVDASKGHYYIQYTDAPYSDGSTNIKSAPFYDDYMSIVNSFKTSQ